MQATRNLITILVKLPTRVKFGHYDFGCTAFWFVFVVVLNSRGYASTVIDDGYRLIVVNRN